MILYNVTVKVEHAIHNDWVQWMQEIHIPDVMATGLFKESRMSRLLGVDESDGFTYTMQYLCPSMEMFQNYQQLHSLRLQKEVRERYGEQTVAFRTVMKVVYESR